MQAVKFVLNVLKKIGRGILSAIDWFFMAVSASRRPTSRDDSNATFGLDQLDPLGERMGQRGPRPGERRPPGD